MKTWHITRKQGSMYLEGHACPGWEQDEYPDTLLIKRYPAGDVDTICAEHPNMEHLHSALYDLYQGSKQIKEGDNFELDGKILFKTESFHVVRADA